MQANPAPARTFTESARRAQIVAAAIATIAELGYHKASFAQIARRAGLSSTGLISYHFAGKDELIGEVVAAIVGEISAVVGERVQSAAGARAALRTYITASIEFIGTHRAEMRALLDIFLAGGFDYDSGAEAAAVRPVEQILRAGQRSGEFRPFDPAVMATLVQRSIDALPFLLVTSPDTDVDGYAGEVATVFDLATRATP